MRNPVRIISIIAGIWLLGITLGVGYFIVRGAGGDRAEVPARVEGLRLLPVEMTDHDGSPLTMASLDGGVTIVSFIFTSCPLICPSLTRELGDVQQRLAGTGVRLLSISVDGEHDTPERLRAFAEANRADLSTWTFATADPQQVHRLVEEGLLMLLEQDAGQQIPSPDGGTMDNIIHPERVVLIGPDRAIYGLYSTRSDEDLAALERDARLLTSVPEVKGR